MTKELCKSCQPLEMKLRREPQEPESPEKLKANGEVSEAGFKEPLEKKDEDKAEDDKVEETSVRGDQVKVPAAASSQAPEKLQLPRVSDPSESSAISGPLRRQQKEHWREEAQSSSEKYRLRKDEPKALVLEDLVVGATFADPRFRQQKLGVIAFSRLDPDLCPLSRLCRAQVLSNAFDLGRAGLVLAAPCSRSSSRFRNAEAAYQATWNWPLSGLFQELGPVAAIRKVQRFGTYRDQTRGGFVNSWRAMRAVLEAKFAPNSAVAAVLLKSGDAFLLDTGGALQSEPPSEDMPENWIGLLLMIVRDKLSKSTAWTEYIQNFCDLENGKGSKAALAWQADFKHTFDIFTDEFGALGTDAVLGMMGYLSYEMSPEVVQKLVVSVDVDQSGTLNFSEFLFFMRKVHEREVQRLEDELRRLTRGGASDREDLLTSLLRVLGYLPDQEAIRDAAADSNISLGAVMPRRGSAQLINAPNRGSVLADEQAKSLRLLTVGGQVTTTQKLLTIGEAYRFLEVYRRREGFTRAETAELKAFFEKYAHESDHEKRISCLDAGRILSRLGYKSTHNEHELLFTEVDIASAGDISLAEFLKLVRKYRHKELDQIRASYLKLGIVGGAAGSCFDGRQVMKQSMNFLGMRDPTESMSIARSRTEKTPAQRMKDAEDARYGILQTAVAKRNQLRVLAQQHHGFDMTEVQTLRSRFTDHDSDGSGLVQASELRTLCQVFQLYKE
eukprot:s1269_g6.t1